MVVATRPHSLLSDACCANPPAPALALPLPAAALRDTQVPPLFQITTPAIGANRCLEVCTSCNLPAQQYGEGAAYVFLNERCTAANTSLANAWRAVRRYTDWHGPYFALVNALTSKCLTEDNSTFITGTSAVGMKLLRWELFLPHLRSRRGWSQGAGVVCNRRAGRRGDGEAGRQKQHGCNALVV